MWRPVSTSRRINLIPVGGGNTVTIPVAFVKQQGSVTLTNTCSPLSIAKTSGLSHCTVTAQNLGSVAANTSISVANRAGNTLLHYKNIAAPGTMIGAGKGVHWNGSLNAASAPPLNSFNNITGAGPAGGYLPLSLFGIAPIAGVGDDTITNFNTPTYYYGGEPYTSIGVVSNGYVVIGGGTASDVVLRPADIPERGSAEQRDRSVLDRSQPAGGRGDPHRDAYRRLPTTGSSSTGPRVKNFSNANTHTVRSGSVSPRARREPVRRASRLTCSYGAANAGSGDSGSGINWGAENRDGSSGGNLASAPADNTEWRPAFGGPVPGGSVTLGFDIWGPKVGSWFSDARMTSNQTTGTAIAPRRSRSTSPASTTRDERAASGRPVRVRRSTE